MSDSRKIVARFALLSTALIADAAQRAGLVLRVVGGGLKPVNRLSRAAGRVLPAKHVGSVDVFLEAIEGAQPGDVLVIDNDGRNDEACIGDLTALEALAGGLGGMIVWGFHRDTAELQSIAIPVFSYGALPAGPRRLDPSAPAAETRFAGFDFGRSDFVFADSDGAVFVEADRVEEIVGIAESISATERRQAEAIRAGKTLREQLRFGEYLAEKKRDPSYTLRKHLQKIGGAIEV